MSFAMEITSSFRVPLVDDDLDFNILKPWIRGFNLPDSSGSFTPHKTGTSWWHNPSNPDDWPLARDMYGGTPFGFVPYIRSHSLKRDDGATTGDDPKIVGTAKDCQWDSSGILNVWGMLVKQDSL
jgi:hypothetical protein